jgi:peptidoglycan-N-acetylglucosamine deacetylase
MLKNGIVNRIFLLLLLGVMFSDVFGEVSAWIYVAIGLLYSLIQGAGSVILSLQFFIPVRYSGDKAFNRIAITFDDGPVMGKTERILDILKSRNVSAAFFCIGNRVKTHPVILSRIHDEGHLVGNHSYWHGKTFDLQTSEKISEELKATDEVIVERIGKQPRFFRPPYGVTNPMVANAITRGNYTTVGWTLRSFDTITKDSAKLLERVTRTLKAGDIILFHDYCDSTIEILPALLDHIAQIGLKIVRVDELLNEKGYV